MTRILGLGIAALVAVLGATAPRHTHTVARPLDPYMCVYPPTTVQPEPPLPEVPTSVCLLPN